MNKNVLGRERESYESEPPHNGICPNCNRPITKNVLGRWKCKSCDICFNASPENPQD
jgi:ribosomal protein L37AE/L43A